MVGLLDLESQDQLFPEEEAFLDRDLPQKQAPRPIGRRSLASIDPLSHDGSFRGFFQQSHQPFGRLVAIPRSIPGILREHLENERLHARGQIRNKGSEGWRGLLNMLVHRLQTRPAPERSGSGQGDVGGHAERIDVDTGSDPSPLHDLGSEEGYRANDLIQTRQVLVDLGPDESEIEYLDLAVPGEHEIARLDVSVHDRRHIPMSRAESTGRTSQDRKGLPPGEDSTPDDALGQCLPFEILHHDVVLLLGPSDMEHPDHIRVIETRSQARLTLKTLDFLLGGRGQERQDLDRHVRAQNLVGRPIDQPHPPPPDQFLEATWTEKTTRIPVVPFRRQIPFTPRSDRPQTMRADHHPL